MQLRYPPNRRFQKKKGDIMKPLYQYQPNKDMKPFKPRVMGMDFKKTPATHDFLRCCPPGSELLFWRAVRGCGLYPYKKKKIKSRRLQEWISLMGDLNDVIRLGTDLRPASSVVAHMMKGGVGNPNFENDFRNKIDALRREGNTTTPFGIELGGPGKYGYSARLATYIKNFLTDKSIIRIETQQERKDRLKAQRRAAAAQKKAAEALAG